MIRWLTCLICSLVISLAISQSDGPLGDLYLAKSGGIAHYSSEDPTGGNRDHVGIAPGEKLTLVDHEGAGVLRRWWLTIAPRQNVEIQRTLIVRCYWDNEEQPSVEVPVSDFFGMGFGEWKEYISLPLNMTSGGYNCYWPMPFREHARIEVENTGSIPVRNFYYNIDIRTVEEVPDEALYFHAQYRQSRSKADIPITILETTGRGHYVGTLLSMQPERGKHLGYLEGDEIIYIDGEAKPGIVGTGTEDYFSSGWYYITGEYSAPYHGVTIKDEEKGRINTYRWHIEDPIPFDSSFNFYMEHGGTNDMPGVEYASVAYWYQTHPHPVFPKLPEHLLPLSQISAPDIEAEDLIDRATVSGGSLEVQKMDIFQGSWSGSGQLWWVSAGPGDVLTLPIDMEEAGEYELIGFFTRAPDYGIVRVSMKDQQLGDLVDGYDDTVSASGPISFGKVQLTSGTNNIKITLLGKDARAAGYSGGFLVGIDGFLLRK